MPCTTTTPIRSGGGAFCTDGSGGRCCSTCNGCSAWRACSGCGSGCPGCSDCSGCIAAPRQLQHNLTYRIAGTPATASRRIRSLASEMQFGREANHEQYRLAAPALCEVDYNEADISGVGPASTKAASDVGHRTALAPDRRDGRHITQPRLAPTVLPTVRANVLFRFDGSSATNCFAKGLQ